MSEPRHSIGLRLPVTLHASLRQAADERYLSMNYLAIKAIEEFLNALIPPDELTLTQPRQADE